MIALGKRKLHVRRVRIALSGDRSLRKSDRVGLSRPVRENDRKREEACDHPESK